MHVKDLLIIRIVRAYNGDDSKIYEKIKPIDATIFSLSTWYTVGT